MKRFIITIAVALALLPTLFAGAAIGSVSSIGPVRSGESGMQVDVWTDRGQNEFYNPGDPITVYLRASDDCFVTIYSIGTEGEVSIIFPEYPDDGFVYGGVTYRLPEYYSGMSLRIAGPRGIEYLHAVATRDPGAFLYTSHRGRWHAGIGPIAGDPFLAINSINGRLIRGRHIAATATVSYFIGGHVWYPRYACYDCHARSPRFDPYDLSCSRYSVSIASHYDYWWAYDYHPVRAHFVFGGPFWRFVVRTHPAHRRPHYRYVDFAYGHWNYVPLRPIARPHHKVVYRPSRITTHRSWERSYTRVRANDTWDKRTRDPRVEYRTRDYSVSRDGGVATRGSSTAGGRGRSDSGRDRIDPGRGTDRTRETGNDIRDRSRTSEIPSTGVNTSAASGSGSERNRQVLPGGNAGSNSANDASRSRERNSTDRIAPPAQSRDAEAPQTRSITPTRERAVEPVRPTNDVRDNGRLSPPAQSRDAEASQRREADARERREAEASQRREVEASQRREAEASQRREAEASQRREVEASQRREAEASQRREAEAAQRREAEASQRREAEAAQRREAEASQRREAEAAQRREAEAAQRREAEASQRREAEASQRREAEASQRREAEASQRREAEASQRREAEASQRREAETRQRHEVDAAQVRNATPVRDRAEDSSKPANDGRNRSR